MARFTDAAAPMWDAAIAGMSIAGQILMARRRIENWVFWIAVDLIAVPLFWSRGLYYTSGLYALFLILSIAGLIDWRRALRAQAKAMTRLVCVHGPESTGKTTLSEAARRAFRALLVPELAGLIARMHGLDLDAADLIAIGRTQSALTRDGDGAERTGW